jgi:hypothetical protein
MSQLDLRRKETNPDKVYYDLTLSNANNGDVNPVNSPVLIFNEQRQNAIINNTGEYYLSIVRFQLDTTSLPIVVPLIQNYEQQTLTYTNYFPALLPPIPSNWYNNSRTIYSITITDNSTGDNYQRYINWLPQITNVDVAIPPPISLSSPFQQESEYYYCYNFEWFVNLINNAIQSAITDINASATPPPTNMIAFLAWNTTTNSASIYLDEANFSTITAPATTPLYSIYFNQALFTYFSSFPASYFGSVGVTNGKNYQILVSNTLNGLNQIPLPVSPVSPATQTNCIQINQEWDTTGLWTPVSSIVFTSATFPIVPNRLSPAQTFYNGVLTNLSEGANNSNFAQVITDIASVDLCYKPTLIYSPDAQYRLIDMFGNTPLTNINIQVFWKTKLGSFIPFRLATGNSCSMKLLFTKKTTEQNGGNQ